MLADTFTDVSGKLAASVLRGIQEMIKFVQVKTSYFMLKLHGNTWFEIKIRSLLKTGRETLILRPTVRTASIHV
jgi:hypothetical protein